MKPTSNMAAVDETIKVLIAGGKIELPADRAVVEAARNLAVAVDAEPTNANLWRQYREAIEVLHDHDDIAAGAGDLARLLGSLSAAMVDETTSGSTDGRRSSS